MPDLERHLSSVETNERERILPKLQALKETCGALALAGERIANIVRNLSSFVRLDEAPVKRVDLHEGLETALALLRGRLEPRVEVIREYRPIPPVECMASQINQVFMNLLANAIEAIPARGTIHIKQSAGMKRSEFRSVIQAEASTERSWRHYFNRLCASGMDASEPEWGS